MDSRPQCSEYGLSLCGSLFDQPTTTFTQQSTYTDDEPPKGTLKYLHRKHVQDAPTGSRNFKFKKKRRNKRETSDNAWIYFWNGPDKSPLSATAMSSAQLRESEINVAGCTMCFPHPIFSMEINQRVAIEKKNTAGETDVIDPKILHSRDSSQ